MTEVVQLRGKGICQVSCGGSSAVGNTFFMCVTEYGQVYSWGDGDFGKLGRGGSDGSKIPRLIMSLEVN